MNVTTFSSGDVVASTKVEGVNWMAALGAARQTIGEEGGVPAGASCAVTADGGVRVQDPVSQRIYHLRPLGSGEEPKLPTATKAETKPSAMEYGSTPIAGRSAQDIAREGVSSATTTAASAKTTSSPGYRPPTPGASNPPTAPKPTNAAPGGEPPFKLQPLRARDREPTEQNPVTFRERTYVAPPDAPTPSIELLLRQEFAKIKKRLGTSRSATYIAMAVFDHAWSKKPERPPVVALDWKDWRGADPQITFPLSSPSSRPPPQQPPIQPGISAESTRKGTGQTRIERPSERAAPLTPNVEAPALEAPALEAPESETTDPDPQPQGPAVATPIAEVASERQVEEAGSEEAGSDPLDHDFPAEPEWTLSDASSGDLRLDIAFERSQQLFSLRSPKDGLDFIIDLLDQLVPSDAFTGAIYDIDTDELRFVAVRGDGSDGLQGHAIPAKAGTFGSAAQLAGGSMNIADFGTNQDFIAEIDGRKGVTPQSALYLPVAAEGRLLAVVQCVNRKGADVFSDEDIEVASYLCSQLSEFLGVARRSLIPSRVP